jgi:phage protein D
MRKPAYRISLDGLTITDRISPRLISLTLTDKRGLEADELELVLSDHDGRLQIPPRNATLDVSIGWQDDLVDKGSYVVDEAEHSGAPDRLRLRARSADFRDAGAAKRSQSWDKVPLGTIVSDIATRQDLTPVTAPELGLENVKHLDQTNESDRHLLTRLAERFDAIAAVKDGNLLFSPRGQGTKASGLPMPTATLTRQDGDRHRWTSAERESYDGVIAEWHDLDSGERQEAVAGSEENAKRLRSVYATEEEALDAAQGEKNRIDRGTAEFSLTLAEGQPDLTPETRLTLQGFKEEIDGTDWIVTECRHRMDDGGYITEITAEVKSA